MELEREDPSYNSDVPPEARFTVAVLGGLRGVVSEFLRIHASNLQREGKYVELAQLSAWLTQLDPHSADTWSVAAWNMAYNIAATTDVPSEKWRWVEAGLKLLRDDALRINPRDPALHYELLWLFLGKVNGTLDDSGEYFNSTWRGIVTEAASRGDWASLGMDYALMQRVDEAYGPLDWADPVSSALYWGEDGLEKTTPEFSERLRMGIGLCLIAKVRADPSYAERSLAALEALSARGARSVPLEEMAQTIRDFLAERDAAGAGK